MYILTPLLHAHQQFDLADVTHRRNILDPTKLEYLNRRHLQGKISTTWGLDSLVSRVLPLLTASFPQRFVQIAPIYLTRQPTIQYSQDLINRTYVEAVLPPLLVRSLFTGRLISRAWDSSECSIGET